MKNFSKEFLLNFLIVFILVFFALNRFLSHQAGACEDYAARIMQPALTVQQSWINYWRTRQQERMSVAQAQQELAEVRNELERTQSELIAVHGGRLYTSLTLGLTTTEAATGPADAFHSTRRVKTAHPELIEGSERNQGFIEAKVSPALTASAASDRTSGPGSKTLVVALKNITDDSHFMLIEGGSDQGLEPDMVCVYQNNLIGRITEVYDHLSKVLLVTDRSCKVAAMCANNQVQGIYEGCNKPDEGALCHVSHLFQVTPDDLVLTSGEGLLFPRGFCLGRITHAERVGVNYEISVKPLIDIRAITAVAILPKKASGMAASGA